MAEGARVSVAMVLVALVGILSLGESAASPTPPDPRLTVEVAPNQPGPFEPMLVTVAREECPAGSEVTARVTLHQYAFDPSDNSDVVRSATLASADDQADDQGRATFELEVPIAYPGSWSVEVVCGDAPGEPAWAPVATVVPRDDFVATISPSTLRRGEPYVLNVGGRSCGGVEAVWDVGIHHVANLAAGTARPDASGTWTASISGTMPVDWEVDSVVLSARCVYDSGVFVHYDTPFAEVLDAEPPPPTPPAPVAPSHPTFAG